MKWKVIRNNLVHFPVQRNANEGLTNSEFIKIMTPTLRFDNYAKWLCSGFDNK